MKQDDPKSIIISEARRLCMSYCIFAFTMPDMFGYESPEPSPLKPYLLLNPDDDKGIDFEFLDESVRRFAEDESIKPAFITAVEALSQELSFRTIDDDHKPYVMVCSSAPNILSMSSC